jgi:hypothetical protein
VVVRGFLMVRTWWNCGETWWGNWLCVGGLKFAIFFDFIFVGAPRLETAQEI